jgi:hypothetical protein
MFAVWDKWKLCVPVKTLLTANAISLTRQVLPAITADNVRVKILAWNRWRSAMDRARRARALVERRDKELLGTSTSTTTQVHELT